MELILVRLHLKAVVRQVDKFTIAVETVCVRAGAQIAWFIKP